MKKDENQSDFLYCYEHFPLLLTNVIIFLTYH